MRVASSILAIWLLTIVVRRPSVASMYATPRPVRNSISASSAAKAGAGAEATLHKGNSKRLAIAHVQALCLVMAFGETADEARGLSRWMPPLPGNGSTIFIAFETNPIPHAHVCKVQFRVKSRQGLLAPAYFVAGHICAYLLAGNGLQAAEPVFSAVHEGVDIRHGFGDGTAEARALGTARSAASPPFPSSR